MDSHIERDPGAVKHRTMLPVIRRAACFAFCACLWLAVSACTGRDTVPGTNTAGDAAPDVAPVLPTVTRGADGVERVTFPADAFSRAPQWLMDTVPLAVAGGTNANAEYDLTHVYEVRMLSDNRFVALAGIGARLMVFGADGREERIIGRLGKGPGEFMLPGGVVVLPGDTLFLSDIANNRLNWVLPDGRFVRTPAMRWIRSPRDPEQLAGVLADGRVILHSAGVVSGTESDSVFRSTASVMVQPIEGRGRAIAAIPDLAQRSVPMRIRGQLSNESQVLFFTPHASIVLWDSLVTTSAGDSYAIIMRSPSGRVVRELSMPLQRRPVTPADRERVLAAQLEQIDSRGGGEGGGDTYTKQEQREFARRTPFADSMPVVQALFTSPDGTLWVLDQSTASGTSGYALTAYRKDGAMVGRLELGDGPVPVAIGNDRVVLRVRDENDVVALRVNRIAPAR